jgi:arginine/ornithine N-succinyltransferase beta subunit
MKNKPFWCSFCKQKYEREVTSAEYKELCSLSKKSLVENGVPNMACYSCVHPKKLTQDAVKLTPEEAETLGYCYRERFRELLSYL